MHAFTVVAILTQILTAGPVPTRLGYQGRLLKADGTPEIGSVDLTFGLYDTATPTGVTPPLWAETQTVALSGGFYSLYLGDNTPVGCLVSDCTGIPADVFDGRELYLQLSVNGEALSPLMRVDAVAYALLATNARNVVGGEVSASKVTVNGSSGVVLDASGISIGAHSVIDATGKVMSAAGVLSVVATSAPLSGDGTSTSPLVVSQAGASTSGYLSSSDWSAFSGKVSSVGAGDTSVTVAGTATNPTVAVNKSTIQSRITTSCGTGYAAVGVNADGSLVCSDVVRGVAVSAPLTSSGGSAPALAITQATSVSSGYLAAGDWTAFATKMNAVAHDATLAGNGTSASPLTVDPSVCPMPKSCPLGQVAVSLGTNSWGCATICSAGTGDCDGNANNGCEVSVAQSGPWETGPYQTHGPDATHTCGAVVLGQCQNATYIQNCGSCNNGCDTYEYSASCNQGSCAGVCAAGYGDCDSNRRTNGCETYTPTDPNNCGVGGGPEITGTGTRGCGVICSVAHMATRTCGAGICNGTCASGYANCNINKQLDGCEDNVGNDANNCGAGGATGTNDPQQGLQGAGCGVVCSSNNVAKRCGDGSIAGAGACSGNCGSSVCNGDCAVGYADCNGNKQTDGCETHTFVDKNNCGLGGATGANDSAGQGLRGAGCGVVCGALQNCVNGVCQ